MLTNFVDHLFISRTFAVEISKAEIHSLQQIFFGLNSFDSMWQKLHKHLLQVARMNPVNVDTHLAFDSSAITRRYAVFM
jgi:hypothetical protein